MTAPAPYWVAGQRRSSDATLTVTSPYDGSTVGTTSIATAQDVDDAVQAAATVADELRRLSAGERAAALAHVSERLAARADEVARLITAENGKPLRWARVEVSRAVSTFRWAAEEARRFSGELQRLDTDPAAKGRLALVTRRPRGPVLGIAPFNFPLNLVAHKVAPALAVGAPIVVKPAPSTPLTALLLGDLLAETDLPPGAWSVLPIDNDAAAALVRDPRLPVVSFTGSGPVGWGIRDAVPRKHVVLELGGNAAAVVCGDWSSDEDLAWAAERLATFGMYQAGQSCIAVQRVYVHDSLHDALVERLVERVGALGVGDPLDEDTVVGPLLDEKAGARVQEWVREAVEAGGRLLCGGERDGTTFAPTVVADVPEDARLVAEEVFGPVLVVNRVAGDEEAFARVNASRYGLQAGVFTHDVRLAFRARDVLDVGGVVIGDVPSFRADQMPYGGVKDSGTGREGVRAAMEDLTEQRVLVLTGLAL